MLLNLISTIGCATGNSHLYKNANRNYIFRKTIELKNLTKKQETTNVELSTLQETHGKIVQEAFVLQESSDLLKEKMEGYKVWVDKLNLMKVLLQSLIAIENTELCTTILNNAYVETKKIIEKIPGFECVFNHDNLLSVEAHFHCVLNRDFTRIKEEKLMLESKYDEMGKQLEEYKDKLFRNVSKTSRLKDELKYFQKTEKRIREELGSHQ
ncbi:hypothetical protein ECANGB1_787 [Enterospora canceri]|uniref:Uncharacterized protein n=1 Tax=Enterospora canceri TaxID=1081671 RepID=A0A1Y1S7G9_9MICR|nr:hypothetical protein ECANGB1_787 [Enterospora canceri]